MKKMNQKQWITLLLGAAVLLGVIFINLRYMSMKEQFDGLRAEADAAFAADFAIACTYLGAEQGSEDFIKMRASLRACDRLFELSSHAENQALSGLLGSLELMALEGKPVEPAVLQELMGLSEKKFDAAAVKEVAEKLAS